MQFYDFRRTLTVEGRAPDQVDAVFSALRDDLVRLSSAVGGSGVTFIAKAVLPVLFSSIALMFLLIWLQSQTRQYGVPALVAACCAVALLFLPTEKFLAGFQAVEGDPSFLVRYGAEISFLGLVIGIVALPVSYFFARPHRRSAARAG